MVIDDRGGSLVVRPLPDDPIGAAVASLRGRVRGPSTEEIRREEREAADEREASRSHP